MTTINEIQDEYTYSILEECINKCNNVPALVSLKQVMEMPDGTSQAVDVSQFVVHGMTKTFINDNKFYVRLVTAVDTDLSHVYSTWETLLERGTQRKLQNKSNDYAMVIDFVKEDQEKGYVYVMSYINPMFISHEDDALLLVFDIDNMRFEKSNVDFVEVYNEVQYAEEVDKAAEIREEDSDNNEYDENDDIISNDDILSNDEYLL